MFISPLKEPFKGNLGFPIEVKSPNSNPDLEPVIGTLHLLHGCILEGLSKVEARKLEPLCPRTLDETGC